MNFESYLLTYHNLTINDIEISDSKGYWIIKKECGGKGICTHPLHSCLGCENPTHHTIYFTDSIRDSKGRFSSPYKTWNKLREMKND